MRVTRLFFIFFYFILCLQPLSAEYFQKIGLSDGLTQPTILSISQDKLGRMWFGTREGLNIFDGEVVTPYKGWIHSGDSLMWLGNEITDIVSDKRGDVYFISDYNLMKYELVSDQFKRLSFDERTRGLTSYEGQVWFVRNDSIFYLNSSNQTSSFYDCTESELMVKDLIVTKENIFIGHKNGLYVIDRKTHEYKNHLENIWVQYLFLSSEKELWIGTRMHGMYWTSLQDGIIHKVPFTSDSSKGFQSKQIRQFVEDDERNVWFGTFDGLYKYDVIKREYRKIEIPEKVGV